MGLSNTLKTYLSDFSDGKGNNKLFWAAAIYDGDPLVLDAPDYDIHVFPRAATLINSGVNIICERPIPHEYHFAQRGSGKIMHLRKVCNPQTGLELISLFTDIGLLLNIFTSKTRVSIVDFKTVCSLCLQEQNTPSGIIINPGRDNLIIPADRLSC